MITPAQLYAATNNGLDIIAMHYPQARDAARTGAKFKKRSSERTASTSIRLRKSAGGNPVWQVMDFGADEHAKDPIDIHREITGTTFGEAMLELAAMFGVVDELNKSVNRPEIRKEPAKEDQPDGSEWFELDEGFTQKQCKIMGPKVSPEVLTALHWSHVKVIARVKDRTVVYRYSTENFPIFIRECWFTNKDGKRDCFYKIYEPLNPDKGFRFSYMPRGKKEPDYLNGLEELRAEYDALNKEEEKRWASDPANENRPYKPRKLECAALCSGERDSLCCKSQGVSPLWLNSETAPLTPKMYNEVMRYVDTLYNIPDIDETGRRRGVALALEYMDIYTVWLPSDYLSQYKDNRGKPRKDLRDWMELRQDRQDFQKLLDRALPARFWDVYYVERGKGDRMRLEPKYSIDSVCLQNFLQLNGFYTLKDEGKKDTQYIKITENAVELIQPKAVRAFVNEWAAETAQPRGLRNLILNTDTLSAAKTDSLKEVQLDFSNSTPTSQWFYFPNCAVEVTAREFFKEESTKANSGRYVWKQKIINHRFRQLEPMFEITHPDGHTASEDFDIKVFEHGSNYFNYLINSSRLYWRTELEYNLGHSTPAEREAYRRKHKFDIAGPGLSDEEIRDQKRCLINKIFCIGYLMHRYKERSRPWAPFVMDNIIGENDQCNGGSGKSFMFLALGKLARYIPLNCRNNKLLENQFWAENINKHVDLVLFEDLDEYFPIKDLYNVISGDMVINPKNASSFTLPFEEAPKFAFTTNYVPKEFNGSTVRRQIYCVTSDYYHQKTEENDYEETRSIRDDFGKELMDGIYSEEEWNADINFIMQCVQFYLSVRALGIKIEPKMNNIIFRKYMRDMNENFRDWAAAYFAEDGDHLDRNIIRQDAYEDFKRSTGLQKTNMQGFTKALKAFVYTTAYIDELNPADECNSGARILKRIDDPNNPALKKSVEMIHLRTVKKASELQAKASGPRQTLLEGIEPGPNPDYPF